MQSVFNFSLFLCPALNEIIKTYDSKNDVSLAKGIPMNLLKQVQQDLRMLSKLENRKFRTIFRGPRQGFHNGYCRKEDAHSFAIYRCQ